MFSSNFEKNDYSNCDYSELLNHKKYQQIKSGFEIESSLLNEKLFDFQKDIVKWAIKKGRCALFEDTGLGKTLQQLEFAYQINQKENKPVLILSPLAVSIQTAKMGERFGYVVNVCESQEDVKNGINITNYEKIHKFDTNAFIGVILDESSILKSYCGKTTNDLIDRFYKTKYKMCCTATPSPNDYTEIGTTAEFLGIKKNTEMLSMFFINDASNGIGWRLKKHAEKEFYKWIGSWAVMIKSPKNLGYDDSKYEIPNLNIETIMVESKINDDSLLVQYAETLSERREARKSSLYSRVEKAKEIIESNNLENCLIWCDYNNESEALKNAIVGSVEVKGSDKPSHKENAMIGFSNGDVKYLVSKPSICGFGMNWQNCNNMIFCGLSDSFEMFYQAIRRCYRFGQKQDVNVYIIISEAETNVLHNIQEKEKKHNKMSSEMIEIMEDIMKSEISNNIFSCVDYEAKQDMKLPLFVNEDKTQEEVIAKNVEEELDNQQEAEFNIFGN